MINSMIANSPTVRKPHTVIPYSVVAIVWTQRIWITIAIGAITKSFYFIRVDHVCYYYNKTNTIPSYTTKDPNTISDINADPSHS